MSPGGAQRGPGERLSGLLAHRGVSWGRHDALRGFSQPCLGWPLAGIVRVTQRDCNGAFPSFRKNENAPPLPAGCVFVFAPACEPAFLLRQARSGICAANCAAPFRNYSVWFSTQGAEGGRTKSLSRHAPARSDPERPAACALHNGALSASPLCIGPARAAFCTRRDDAGMDDSDALCGTSMPRAVPALGLGWQVSPPARFSRGVPLPTGSDDVERSAL